MQAIGHGRFLFAVSKLDTDGGSILKHLKNIISDLLIVIGLEAVTVGAWMIYRPAGWLVAGIALIGFGWLIGLTGGETQ